MINHADGTASGVAPVTLFGGREEALEPDEGAAGGTRESIFQLLELGGTSGLGGDGAGAVEELDDGYEKSVQDVTYCQPAVEVLAERGAMGVAEAGVKG